MHAKTPSSGRLIDPWAERLLPRKETAARPHAAGPGWRRLRHSWLPGLLCLLGATASAQVVVVGATNPVAALTREQVTDAFLGRMAGIEPVDQAEGSPVREAFYTKLVGKTAHQLKSYWARLEFTGRAMPPRQVRDGREIKRYLSRSPRAIAYLDKAEVDSSLRVVFESD
jgi:hypothetical protein